VLGREHVRQGGIGIAAGIEIEEDRAGNVAGFIFGGWVAIAARQIP
jgi:hypothetical protein